MIFNSLRVYITEQCNAKCPNCFNKINRGNLSMDIEHFRKICDYFSSKGVKRIKIMGGEPTIHPEFKELMIIAQEYFQQVFLFTNAINDGIFNFNPRESDSIIYNFTFHKLWDNSKFLMDKMGKRAFEIQIRNNTNIDEVILYLKNINSCDIYSVITLDCTSNIFDHRAILIEKINRLQEFLVKNECNNSMDHRIPLCFLYNSNIVVPTLNFSVCSLECSSLIDAGYNLRFCNQSSEILLNIFQNNDIVPFQIIENALTKEFYNRQLKNLNKICSSCVFYGRKCNGGCFINNEKITKEIIVNSTDFPTL